MSPFPGLARSHKVQAKEHNQGKIPNMGAMNFILLFFMFFFTKITVSLKMTTNLPRSPYGLPLQSVESK